MTIAALTSNTNFKLPFTALSGSPDQKTLQIVYSTLPLIVDLLTFGNADVMVSLGFYDRFDIFNRRIDLHFYLTSVAVVAALNFLPANVQQNAAFLYITYKVCQVIWFRLSHARFPVFPIQIPEQAAGIAHDLMAYGVLKHCVPSQVAYFLSIPFASLASPQDPILKSYFIYKTILGISLFSAIQSPWRYAVMIPTMIDALMASRQSKISFVLAPILSIASINFLPINLCKQAALIYTVYKAMQLISTWIQERRFPLHKNNLAMILIDQLSYQLGKHYLPAELAYALPIPFTACILKSNLLSGLYALYKGLQVLVDQAGRFYAKAFWEETLSRLSKLPAALPALAKPTFSWTTIASHIPKAPRVEILCSPALIDFIAFRALKIKAHTLTAFYLSTSLALLSILPISRISPATAAAHAVLYIAYKVCQMYFMRLDRHTFALLHTDWLRNIHSFRDQVIFAVAQGRSLREIEEFLCHYNSHFHLHSLSIGNIAVDLNGQQQPFELHIDPTHSFNNNSRLDTTGFIDQQGVLPGDGWIRQAHLLYQKRLEEARKQLPFPEMAGLKAAVERWNIPNIRTQTILILWKKMLTLPQIEQWLRDNNYEIYLLAENVQKASTTPITFNGCTATHYLEILNTPPLETDPQENLLNLRTTGIIPQLDDPFEIKQLLKPLMAPSPAVQLKEDPLAPRDPEQAVKRERIAQQDKDGPKMNTDFSNQRLEPVAEKDSPEAKLASELCKEEKNFICPISQVLMIDPYIAKDGYTYEKADIERFLTSPKWRVSPISKAEITDREIIPNRNLKSQIEQYNTVTIPACADLAEKCIKKQYFATAKKLIEHIKELDPQCINTIEICLKKGHLAVAQQLFEHHTTPNPDCSNSAESSILEGCLLTAQKLINHMKLHSPKHPRLKSLEKLLAQKSKP